MDRLIAPNSVAFASRDQAPGSGTPQYATDGVPGVTPATYWPAYQYNAIQDEIMAVIAQAALTADKTDWKQLVQALLLAGTYVDAGSANSIAINPPITIEAAAIKARTTLTFIAAATNTSRTVNANVSGNGNVRLKGPDGADPQVGDIIIGRPYTIVHNGTFWLAVAGVAASSASAFSNFGTGAFRNIFRNATCAVATRGVTGTAVPGVAYTLDGHQLGCSGANITWAQDSSLGEAPYSLKFTGQAGVLSSYWQHRVESLTAVKVAGKNAIFQIKVKNNSGSSFTPALNVSYANAANNFGAITSIVSASLQACPNAATTTCFLQIAMPANAANGLQFILDPGSGQLGGVGRSYNVGDFDCSVGLAFETAATLPHPEMRNVAMEQLECGRFLPVIAAGGANQPIGVGAMQNANDADTTVFFTPEARAVPSGVVVSAASDFKMTKSGSNFTCTSITLNNAGTRGANLIVSDTNDTWAAQDCTQVNGSTGASSIYFTGCEL